MISSLPKLVCLAVATSWLVCAERLHAEPASIADELRGFDTSQLLSTAIGVTRRGTSIDAAIAPEDLDYRTNKTRVLVVAGIGGDRGSTDAALASVRWFYQHPDATSYRKRFAISVIPCVNPDGLSLGKGPANGSNGNPTRGYPPKENAYNSKTDPEAAYVWRWIGMHAPDLVLELTLGEAIRAQVAEGAEPSLLRLAQSIDDVVLFAPNDSLVAQLASTPPCDTGTIPAIQVSVPPKHGGTSLAMILNATTKSAFATPSPARNELQRRLSRSPRKIKDELLSQYGGQLKQVVYIQSLAVIGRMRHAERLAADSGRGPDYAQIEDIAKEYFSGSKTASLMSGSDLSGHLIFSELAARFDGDRRARYIELARAAAELAFNDQGVSNSSMPFHNEMSDALFMGGPILAQVGQLTGETRYFDACAKHLRFMRQLDWREDGLYRHSPLDEAAWGRGNGFPAIGVAMCLDAFPDDHPARLELLESFTRHMAALAKHQDPTGCWHQVIDHPESYREFTSTCMITYAMIRGVSEGWLDAATYSPIINKAWYAIRTRIGSRGTLVDVCTGTGKQKSLRDYFDRTAILGRDDRGGAMALLVANEIDSWQQRNAISKPGESR
ncbi:MAG: glycoside hydrolase family 88 protein [Planctomycetes bacterium]|nr:glycoside hydrolase family 88 protein [Planctomycetota bacterium]